MEAVERKKEFFHSINYFRAFAIIAIVLIHCFYLVEIELQGNSLLLFQTLIDGGTHYFIFISGFLFHYLFYPKYTFKTFYLGRVKRIFLPYIFIGVPAIIIYVFFWTGPLHDVFFSYDGESKFLFYAIPFLKYFFTGRMLMPFWYIPFIMVLYLFSFTFIYFIKLKPKNQLAWIFALLMVSITIHRPYLSLNVIQNVVYFIPVFLSGIFFSQHRSDILKFWAVKKRYLLFFLASVIFGVVHALVFKHEGSSFKHFYEITVPDFMILHRLFLSVGLLIFLSRFDKEEHVSVKFFDAIAKKSFAIFFLHQIFIVIGSRYGLINFIPFSGISKLFFLVAIFILISVLSAVIIKKILPNKSKYLIGY